MLQEAIAYLTTPCPPPFKAMGYLHELIATQARARRCRHAWAPHLQKSRNVIAEAAESAPGRGRAVVLGGGLLGDIPFDGLANRFARVDLIDVCFASATRKAARRFDNVRCMTADVTGVAASIYEWATSGAGGALPEAKAPAGLPLDDADLVISANMLAQLPLVPAAYLRKARPGLSEDDLVRFAQGLIRGHLELLKSCPGTVCLITETERRIMSGETVIETEDPLEGVPPDLGGTASRRDWLWDLAPEGEIKRGIRVRNRVAGVCRPAV